MTVSLHVTDVYAPSSKLPSSIYLDEDFDVFFMPIESIKADQIVTILKKYIAFVFQWCVLHA